MIVLIFSLCYFINIKRQEKSGNCEKGGLNGSHEYGSVRDWQQYPRSPDRNRTGYYYKTIWNFNGIGMRCTAESPAPLQVIKVTIKLLDNLAAYKLQWGTPKENMLNVSEMKL